MITRVAALLVALLAVSACGFTPLYGDHGLAGDADVQAGLSDIRIMPIADREGVTLRRRLAELIQPEGTTDNPQHTLQVGLTIRTQNLNVRKDSTTSRANLFVDAAIYLRHKGRIVYRDTARSIVSYNVLDAQYATVVSKEDATDRALEQVAAEVRTRLALYFVKQAEATVAADQSTAPSPAP